MPNYRHSVASAPPRPTIFRPESDCSQSSVPPQKFQIADSSYNSAYRQNGSAQQRQHRQNQRRFAKTPPPQPHCGNRQYNQKQQIENIKPQINFRVRIHPSPLRISPVNKFIQHIFLIKTIGRHRQINQIKQTKCNKKRSLSLFSSVNLQEKIVISFGKNNIQINHQRRTDRNRQPLPIPVAAPPRSGRQTTIRTVASKKPFSNNCPAFLQRRISSKRCARSTNWIHAIIGR